MDEVDELPVSSRRDNSLSQAELQLGDKELWVGKAALSQQRYSAAWRSGEEETHS